MNDVVAVAIAFGVSFAACWLLAWIARPLGLLDQPGGANAERKLARTPVALVGGLAIGPAAMLAYLWLMRNGDEPLPSFASWIAGPELAWIAMPSAEWRFLALFAAFVVGWIDDATADGLRALPKLMLQSIPAGVVGVPLALDGHPLAGAAWFVAALWAMNAFNTFDNSDGAASCLALVAFALPVPAIAAACAGLLPWNLAQPGPATSGRKVYLGDTGSHMLGLAMLFNPLAAPALLVPSLDLVRVSIVRIREGRKPWEGDLRHLAHLLRARGIRALASAALLSAISAPAIVGARAASEQRALIWSLVGAATTAALFFVLVRWSRGHPAP
jgi:UDP-N-acetylmuramyl pentapeptide phosphotransferase/UDP-N-acetylglucosamine-1-phosphate transferase